MNREDSSEVGHTGGKVTFAFHCNAEGNIGYQIRYSISSVNPASLCGVYAHPDGFACGNIKMGGIGDPWNPPPFSNCVAILMASDSQGRFGHECPGCHKHFRSENIPALFLLTCPYCGLRTDSYHFLTPPQVSYIKHYLRTFKIGIAKVKPKTVIEVTIDMDTVANEVKDKPRPDFYYTSTVQQTEFRCAKCNGYNDIRGKYGYCASCGWRNNTDYLKKELEDIRESLNSKSTSPEDGVKQSVSAFDSASRNYVEQLVNRIPMLNSRRNQLDKLLFHNVDKFDELLQSCFGINILKGMGTDRDFIKMMFYRRHVYEHDGGVATERYTKESGDYGIEEGTLIRETLENAHRFIGCLNRMFSTFDSDFHELFPPEEFCINIENQKKTSMAQ